MHNTISVLLTRRENNDIVIQIDKKNVNGRGGNYIWKKKRRLLKLI